jgi:lysophospholipid acyltransferase (LPLAT)-like uncharacterized protein
MNETPPAGIDVARKRRIRNRSRKRSQRRMTWQRKLLYRIAIPTGIAILRFFWATCRIERVIGGGYVESQVLVGKPLVFCYWHRHQLFCWKYLRQLIDRGAKIGWLISASVDGEVPAGMAKVFGGGIVFRGSTTAGGSEALRAICKAIRLEGISTATTPDGPYGPRSEFKPGVVKMAQLSGAPLLPLAYAARRGWVLRTWDRFVVPKPFTRIVVAAGEPVDVPRDCDDECVHALQRRMEHELEAAYQAAAAAVQR